MDRFWIVSTFLGLWMATSDGEVAVAQDPASFLKTLKPRNIGPANMSGRVTDIAVVEAEPRTFYVASAASGLWATRNHGMTWKPIFERQPTSSIGAVAVFQADPKIIWVGGGEANLRNSVSWGDGVYRSDDAGATWRHCGLGETQHIGRIILHPKDPNIAYVAALGRAWGPNRERGVFKTVDGGKSWDKVLYFDENTGAVELAIDPGDANTLYACMYQVRRGPFSGGNPATQTGPRAGLYKSVDAGKSWAKLTNGLPARPHGRCGIAVFRGDPKTLFAVVQTDKTPDSVKGQAPNQKLQLDAGGLFRSDDRGTTWRHVNSLVPRPFYYGQIRVDPSDVNRVYVLGVNFHVSSNAGEKFNDANAAKGTHVDYHALWINPRDSHHLVLGCDGGVNLSFDRGDHWEYLRNLPISQFYAVGLDMRSPYRIYGGLQDNGTWGGPSRTRDANGITLADWTNLLGFDGYYAQVDPDDPNTVFCEGQYGILRRVNLKSFESRDIKPRLAGKDVKSNIVSELPSKHPGFRFNWSSPILLSPHPGKALYFAGNHLFRSTDRGETWRIISPDMTRGKPGPSDVSGHTITALAESPRKAGLLYVGTDDGRVHGSSDGGANWSDLSQFIPNTSQDRWISRLECSHHKEDVVFLSIDRHRNNDPRPYLFRSSDHGRSWQSIAGNLPIDGFVHVIRQDPINPELLYVGTEFGLFLSFDGGQSWHKQNHLPTVPVHDLAIHPRDRELVIATHGRGIYVMELSPLQEIGPNFAKSDVWLFDVAPAEAHRIRPIHSLGIKAYTGDNPPPGAELYYFLRKPVEAEPLLVIEDAKGKRVFERKVSKDAGLHYRVWSLMQPKTPPGSYRPVPAGTYRAVLRIGPREWRKDFMVRVED